MIIPPPKTLYSSLLEVKKENIDSKNPMGHNIPRGEGSGFEVNPEKSAPV
jgi:hypothetical protein